MFCIVFERQRAELDAKKQAAIIAVEHLQKLVEKEQEGKPVAEVDSKADEIKDEIDKIRDEALDDLYDDVDGDHEVDDVVDDDEEDSDSDDSDSDSEEPQVSEYVKWMDNAEKEMFGDKGDDNEESACTSLNEIL